MLLPGADPPARPPRRWVPLVASLLAHGALIVVIAVLIRRPGSFPVPVSRFIALAPATAGSRLELPRYGGSRPGWPGKGAPGLRRPGMEPTPLPAPLPAPGGKVLPAHRPTATPAGAPTPAGPGIGAFGIVAPGLGRAKLWVEPLPLAPRELAAALSSGNVRLVDSAITVIVRHYLDSVATAPDRDRGPPDWTTQVAGTKFGLDAKNIYLAGLKIPTAVLALLKLPGANESRVFERGVALMQADVRRAAARAATLDEFRQSVRELRAERERQHQIEENRKRLPTDSAALRPVSPP